MPRWISLSLSRSFSLSLARSLSISLSLSFSRPPSRSLLSLSLHLLQQEPEASVVCSNKESDEQFLEEQHAREQIRLKHLTSRALSMWRNQALSMAMGKWWAEVLRTRKAGKTLKMWRNQAMAKAWNAWHASLKDGTHDLETNQPVPGEGHAGVGLIRQIGLFGEPVAGQDHAGVGIIFTVSVPCRVCVREYSVNHAEF